MVSGGNNIQLMLFYCTAGSSDLLFGGSQVAICVADSKWEWMQCSFKLIHVM